MKYRMIRLNPQVLATMFIGFQRKLFSTPKENDILSIEEANGDCTIYFDEVFWNTYLLELRTAYLNGKFANSNVNSDWINLLSSIQSAQECSAPIHYNDYYSQLKMFL